MEWTIQENGTQGGNECSLGSNSGTAEPQRMGKGEEGEGLPLKHSSALQC